MTTLAPCRKCQPEESWATIRSHELDVPLRETYWVRTRMCAKCKVAGKVYKIYAEKVLRQGRHDLQPCFEFACETYHGRSMHVRDSWPYSCGGCGYSKPTKKMPRVDKQTKFFVEELGGDLNGLKLPPPNAVMICKDAGVCHKHIACVNAYITNDIHSSELLIH